MYLFLVFLLCKSLRFIGSTNVFYTSRQFGRGYRANWNEFSLYEHRWYNFAYLCNLIKSSTYLRSMVKVLRWQRVNVRSLRTNTRIDDFAPTNYLLFPSIFFLEDNDHPPVLLFRRRLTRIQRHLSRLRDRARFFQGST